MEPRVKYTISVENVDRDLCLGLVLKYATQIQHWGGHLSGNTLYENSMITVSFDLPLHHVMQLQPAINEDVKKGRAQAISLFAAGEGVEVYNADPGEQALKESLRGLARRYEMTSGRFGGRLPVQDSNMQG